MTAKPAARRRPKPYASAWSPDECRFADTLIPYWNKFQDRGLPRANKVRRNRFVAIQLYRWIHRDQDADDPTPMTEGDVFVAIEAYSSDTWIRDKCQGRFKSFGDWLRDGADIVDKYLAKAGKQRGHASPAPHDANAVKIHAAVKKTLVHHGWGDFAAGASRDKKTITQAVEDHRWAVRKYRGVERYAGSRRWLAAIKRDMRQFSVLPQEDRDALTTRARMALSTLPDRPEPGTLREKNMLFALARATLAVYGPGTKQQNKEQS